MIGELYTEIQKEKIREDLNLNLSLGQQYVLYIQSLAKGDLGRSFLKNKAVLKLISDAIGGVKLQVYASDKERAITFYKQLKSYVADERGELIPCRICGKKQLEVIYLRKNLFYKLFPFLEPKKYRCDHCNFLSKSLK